MLEKNTRITVTGGHGFLGAFVVAGLKAQGFRDIFVPRSRQFDLTEQSNVVKLYETAKPQVVIHLAAKVGGIGANRLRPGEFFYDNAIMGIQMLEYARRYGVEKFVHVGSICSYPKFTKVPFNEDSIWEGYPEETNAPYGLAKKMVMVQAQAYRAQYGTNAITVMPVNIYGPGEHFDLENSHVIPALIRKCVEAKEKNESELVLWGDGSPTREFLYVEDAAQGIIQALHQYNSGEPVNLGTGLEVSIRSVADTLVDLTGYKGKLVWDTSKPNGQPRRCVSVERAKNAFGFQAKWSLEKGLKATLEWFLENRPDAVILPVDKGESGLTPTR